MTTLRLILGDQLNPLHSWYSERSDDIIYVMLEVRQETDYVLHHAQKILAIFAAMRDFARWLKSEGHQVHFIAIDDPHNRQNIPHNLDDLIRRHEAAAFEYQAPDEWRLNEQLKHYAEAQVIACRMRDTEHFYGRREEAADYFVDKKQWLMENFYRMMRVKHIVLLDKAGKPCGGQWNFDHDNRKSWPGRPSEPHDERIEHNHEKLWKIITEAGVKSFGSPNEKHLPWPLNRREALIQLDAFIETALPYFGDYQDAMNTGAPRLFHSLLSFAINIKMLNPREIVTRAEQAYRDGHASLPAVEGFIRQIIGWREYMRGVYWARMPHYRTSNVFGNSLALPKWFWNGDTKMRCLHHAIEQSLDNGHAHHIQRLMVIGNFALIAGINPDEVHEWYLGVYVDAYEWVELPNVLGMSQFADGGLLATKPYASSAAYIDKMSDYCKRCHNDRKARTAENACPFNALYWHFFDRNAARLKSNPRLAMVYNQLQKMDNEARQAMTDRAENLRNQLDDL
jgi:deoxyribodipyrimidine photolyase-related protein